MHLEIEQQLCAGTMVHISTILSAHEEFGWHGPEQSKNKKKRCEKIACSRTLSWQPGLQQRARPQAARLGDRLIVKTSQFCC